jgi:hypothetical protein
MLCSAERVVGCEVPHFMQARWRSGTEKDKSEFKLWPYSLLKRFENGDQMFGVGMLKLDHADNNTLLGRSCPFLGRGKIRSQQHQDKNQENPTSRGEAAML